MCYSLLDGDPNIIDDENFVKPSLIDKQGLYPVYRHFKSAEDESRYVIEEITDKLSHRLDDDTDEEEESVLPKEVESFQLMRSILAKAFTEYTNEYKSESISDFFVAIQDYLEAFANGIEPVNEFDFSFVLESGNDEYHEIQYIDFHFESEMLQVSSGGSVYDETVGSDRYTIWDYSISLNGWDEGGMMW